MNKKIFIFSLIIALLQTITTNSKNNNCNVIINIEGKKIVFHKDSMKLLSVAIINRNNHTIKVPEWLFIGEKDENPEIYFVVEKYDSFFEIFRLLEGRDVESDYFIFDRKVKYIASNKKYIIPCDIETIKTLHEPGKYRIKAVIHLKDLCQNYIESSWNIFYVKE